MEKRTFTNRRRQNELSQNLQKNSVSNLEDVEFKMERYKVEDENQKMDRWSLDSRLFYNK